MGKMIVFMNQKGGVGKSTLLQCSSINWYINKNESLNNKFVGVIDVDTQYSTANLRNRETEYLQGDPNSRSKFMSRMKQLYSGDREIMKVYNTNINMVLKNYPKMKDEFDYLFVDSQGSAFSTGLDRNFFSAPDLVVVPTKFNTENVRSSIDFINSILIPQQKDFGFKYVIVFNNIHHSQRGAVEKVTLQLRKRGFNVMDSIILGHNKYEKDFFRNTNGALSTLIPVPLVDIDNFNDELEQILNK